MEDMINMYNGKGVFNMSEVNVKIGIAINLLELLKEQYEKGLSNGHVGNKKYVDALQIAIDNLIYGNKNSNNVKQGYWTGLIPRDYAHAEGLPTNATEEERKAYHDMFTHITHCSVCGGQFDSRIVRDWKGCPYCLSTLSFEKPKDESVIPFDIENAQPIIEHDRRSNVIETDKDRLINILNSSRSTSLGEIINEYLNRFGDEAISDYDCSQLMKTMSDVISRKMSKLNVIRSTSQEYAAYLMKYFNDEMYNDADAFVKYKDIQKKNVQSIVDICNSK